MFSFFLTFPGKKRRRKRTGRGRQRGREPQRREQHKLRHRRQKQNFLLNGHDPLDDALAGPDDRRWVF